MEKAGRVKASFTSGRFLMIRKRIKAFMPLNERVPVAHSLKLAESWLYLAKFEVYSFPAGS